MKPEDRELVAQLCAARAGLKIDPDKTYVIESRLGPVARREGYASIPDMLHALRTNREDRLVWAVVESLSSVETAFFRDREAFELLSKDVLPTLAQRCDGDAIKIWSAACGAGQEVYSLAMTVEDQKPHLSNARVELFASDLSERALEKAQSGLYTQFEVQRGLPIRHLVRHFEKLEDMWTPSPRLRQLIRWRRINLAGEAGPFGKFDVIFCRGVLSTMIEPARAKVLEKLALALEPGGFLFLDPSDEWAQATDALQPISEGSGLYGANPAFRAAA